MSLAAGLLNYKSKPEVEEMRLQVQKLVALVLECLARTIDYRESKDKTVPPPLQIVWGYCKDNTVAMLQRNLLHLFNTSEGKAMLLENATGIERSNVENLKKEMQRFEAVRSEDVEKLWRLEKDSEMSREQRDEAITQLRGALWLSAESTQASNSQNIGPSSKAVRENLQKQREYRAWGGLDKVQELQELRQLQASEASEEALEQKIKVEDEPPPVRLSVNLCHQLTTGVDLPDLHGVWIDRMCGRAAFKQIVYRTMRIASTGKNYKHYGHLILDAPPDNTRENWKQMNGEVTPSNVDPSGLNLPGAPWGPNASGTFDIDPISEGQMESDLSPAEYARKHGSITKEMYIQAVVHLPRQNKDMNQLSTGENNLRRLENIYRTLFPREHLLRFRNRETMRKMGKKVMDEEKAGKGQGNWKLEIFKRSETIYCQRKFRSETSDNMES